MRFPIFLCDDSNYESWGLNVWVWANENKVTLLAWHWADCSPYTGQVKDPSNSFFLPYSSLSHTKINHSLAWSCSIQILCPNDKCLWITIAHWPQSHTLSTPRGLTDQPFMPCHLVHKRSYPCLPLHWLSPNTLSPQPECSLGILTNTQPWASLPVLSVSTCAPSCR